MAAFFASKRKRWAHIRQLADASSSLAPATKKKRTFASAFFMYTVYVLHSASQDKIYVGMTSDLAKRSFFLELKLLPAYRRLVHQATLLHGEHHYAFDVLGICRSAGGCGHG